MGTKVGSMVDTQGWWVASLEVRWVGGRCVRRPIVRCLVRSVGVKLVVKLA